VLALTLRFDPHEVTLAAAGLCAAVALDVEELTAEDFEAAAFDAVADFDAAAFSLSTSAFNEACVFCCSAAASFCACAWAADWLALARSAWDAPDEQPPSTALTAASATNGLHRTVRVITAKAYRFLWASLGLPGHCGTLTETFANRQAGRLPGAQDDAYGAAADPHHSGH